MTKHKLTYLLSLILALFVSIPVFGQTMQVSAITGTCEGSSLGSVEFSVVGGVAPYSVVWSNATVLQGIESDLQTIDSLMPGVYSIIVIDSELSVDTISVTVPATASAISGMLLVEDDPGGCNGYMMAEAFGGHGQNYTYEWSNGDSLMINWGLCGDTWHSVTVSDSVGCTAHFSDSIYYNIVVPNECIYSIQGKMVGDGNLLSLGTVYLIDVNDSSEYVDSTSNIINGSFTLTDICKGEYKIVGVAPGFENTYYNSSEGLEDAYVFVIDSNNWASVSLNMAPALGIGNNDAQRGQVHIYPNPSNGIVNVDFDEGIEGESVKITNSVGASLVGLNNVSNSVELDLSEFENGIYFISIETLNGVITKKIQLVK